MASENDVPVIIVRKDTGSGLIPGLLLGLAAGAVAGLLRAPKSGLETRRQITQRLQGARGAVQSKLPGQG